MRIIYLLLLLSWPSLFWAQKISPIINMEQESLIDCFLLLEKQANFKDLPQKGKQAKGAYVFAQLQKAQAAQTPILLELDRLTLQHQSFFLVNAVRVWAKASDLERLAKRTDIARILPNPNMQASFPIAQDNKSYSNWGIEQIRAQLLWALGFKGAEVVVAGQDTGYDWEHPAINRQYRGSPQNDHNYNWHDAIHESNPLHNDNDNPCGFDASAPCDDHSHGTHTVGTMTGFAPNEEIGLAPEAQWIGCRNMDRGWGSPASYLECFEWFLAPTNLNGQDAAPNKAPDVINNSWGCPPVEGCHPDNFALLRQAVINLKAAGIMVVVSAGNEGPSCGSIQNPAAIFGESFVVAASNANDQVAGFSSRGPALIPTEGRPKPDISAPGVAIRSSVLNEGYGSSSGTSMAGPHVAGAVALLLSAAPELKGDVERIEEILRQSAIPIPGENCGGLTEDAHPNFTAGWGRLDIWRALALVRPNLVYPIMNENTYKLSILPNPSQGKIIVVLPNNYDEVEYRLFNLLGQEVAQGTTPLLGRSLPLNFSKIPQGSYLLNVWPKERTSEQFSAKLILQH